MRRSSRLSVEGDSVDQAGDLAQAQALGAADLQGGAFCDAEFVIGHGATPYRIGRVLHSVFAAADFILILNENPTGRES